jgi:hypothetical protein
VRRGAWMAVAAAIAVCAALAGWWTGRRGTASVDNNSLADVSITPFTASSHDERAVRKAIQELIQADNRRDLNAAVDLYASDAMLLSPGLPY